MVNSFKKGYKGILLMIVLIVTSLSFTACFNNIFVKYSDKDLHLLSSIEGANLDGVIESIKEGANIDEVKSVGLRDKSVCPLFKSMEMTHDPVFMYLLEAGADVNYKNDKGINVLMASIIGLDDKVSSENAKQTKYAKTLIEYGADVNEIGINDYNSLDCAIRYNGNNDCIELLIDEGAKITKSTIKVLKSALGFSGEDDETNIDLSLCTSILNQADINDTKAVFNDFEKAIILQNFNEGEHLLNEYAFNKGQSKSIIKFIVAFGDVKFLELFLKKTGNFDDSFWSEMMKVASEYNNAEMLKYLNKKYFSIPDESDDYYTKDILLNVAASKGSNEVIDYLFSVGASPVVNAESFGNGTLLNSTYSRNLSTTTKIVNSIDDISNQDLLEAIRNSISLEDFEMFTYLLDICHKNKYYPETELLSWTCLPSDISVYTNMKFFKYLLENGADPNGTKDDKGEPLAYAIRNEALEQLRILLENGADVDNPYSFQYVTEAILYGSYESLLLLDKYNANFNYNESNWDNDSALQIAKENGSKRIYEFVKSKVED